MKKEYIICCAIPVENDSKSENWPSLDNKDFVLGFSHTDIKEKSALNGITLESSYNDRYKGFLTSELRYVNREKAAEIAFKAKQIKEYKDSLFSGDLDLHNAFVKYIESYPENTNYLIELF